MNDMTCPYCGDRGTRQWFLNHPHPNPFASTKENPMDDNLEERQIEINKKLTEIERRDP